MKHNDPSKAEEIATHWHAGQFRRDGVTPYIEHPRKVVRILRIMCSRYEGDQGYHWLFNQILCIGWLHDILEDTPCDLALLKQHFTDTVVSCVEILTKPPTLPYHLFIDRINNFGPSQAGIVKIADITANLTDSPTEVQCDKYFRALAILSRRV